MSAICVPGYPDIAVECTHHEKNIYLLRYHGQYEDLVRSGIATVEMLAPIARKERSRRKIDEQGHRFCRETYSAIRDGIAVIRYRLVRWVPQDRLIKFAGAPQAVKQYEEREVVARWRHEEWKRANASEPAARSARNLRLVVNNTQE